MEDKANIFRSARAVHQESLAMASAPATLVNCNEDTINDLNCEKPIRLLLLEDDLADRRLIEIYLSYARDIYFTLVHAQCLSEAKYHLKEYQFDIALLDYYLPDGKGVELLKSLSPKLYMPVVVLSGYDNEIINQDLLNNGLYDFIPKLKMNPVLLEKVLKLAMMRAKQLKKRLDEGDPVN